MKHLPTLPALPTDSLQMELWAETLASYEQQLRTLPADTDHETRREALKSANQALNDFDEIRKTVGKPYRDRIEQINHLAKKTTHSLALLVEQQRTVLAKQLEQIEAARKQRERENQQAMQQAQSWNQMPLVHAVPPKPVGSALVWDYEVTDFALLPDEYKVANPVAIRQVMNNRGADGLPAPVAGVRFFQKMQTRL